MENDTKVIIGVSAGIMTIVAILIYQKAKSATVPVSMGPSGAVGTPIVNTPTQPVATYKPPTDTKETTISPVNPKQDERFNARTNVNTNTSPVNPKQDERFTNRSTNPNNPNNTFIKSPYGDAIYLLLPILSAKGSKNNTESLSNQYNAALSSNNNSQMRVVYINTINETNSQINRFHPKPVDKAAADLFTQQALADNGNNAVSLAMNLGTILTKVWTPYF